jgi:hypothetical protein
VRPTRFDHGAARVVALLIGSLMLALPGCVPEGENSVSTRLVRPVVVSVSGDVVDATTRLPLEGMRVEVTRRAIGADAGLEGGDGGAGAEPVLTEATGRYAIPSLELDVERWEYGIRVRDVSEPPRYRDAETGGVYAFQDEAIVLPTLLMVRVENDYRTAVTGEVKEAVRNGQSIGEALVTLAIRETGEVPFSTKTGPDGRFRFDGVPAREYDMVISAGNARVGGEPRAYAPVERVVKVRREDEVPQPGSGLVDLGPIFLVGSAENEDLRIVLTWDRDRPDDDRPPVDLDGYLLLPDEACDVNHLGGAETALGSAAYSISPQGGFGAGTCYWPAFLNGDPGDADRTIVGYESPLHVVEHPAGPDAALYGCTDNADGVAPGEGEARRCVVASLDNDSKDGSQPEVVTFNKELFLREYPRGLGYFYDYKINDAGDTVRHYPAGVAVYTVLLPEPERPDPAGNDLDNINGSGARVEVFQGNTRVAAYDVTEIGLPEALRTWTVLLVEVGFKNPNPRTGDDVYFRVLPFSGLDETIRAGIFAWEDRRAAEAYQPGPDGRPVPAPIREIHAGVDVTGRLVLSGRTDDPGSPYGLWVLRQDPGQPAGFVRVLPDTAPITALSYDSGRVLGARNGLVYEIGGPMRDDGTPLGADCEEEVTLLYSTSVGLSRTVFAGTVGGLRRFDEVRLRCPLVGQSAGRLRDDGTCAGYTCVGAEDAGACLPWEWKCDGFFDCVSGSDESACDGDARACAEGEFRCMSGQCLPGGWQCDFEADCADGEDEAGCNPEGCPGFVCGGQCRRYSAVCDGYVDCPDALDEAGCTPECFGLSCDDGTYCASLDELCDSVEQCRDGLDERLCNVPPCTGRLCDDGACAPWETLCDGNWECFLGEDEAPELCAGGLCEGVRCADEAATCVPWAQVCDDTDHCAGGEDEQNCFAPPCEGFECHNRACLPRAYACDDTPDCPDGEDENGCDAPCAGFRCNDNSCAGEAAVCNGLRDCPDGEDEHQNCDEPCDGLRCSNGSCAPQAYLCDRTADCPEGEDEAEDLCAAACDGYRCGDGSCIPIDGRCDDRPDCADGGDELECAGPCEGFLCEDGGCVPVEGVCNGIEDCPRGDDEARCLAPGEVCEGFECANGVCVEAALRCDAANDCGDNTDEESCDDCPGFPCPSGPCLAHEARCDARSDCPDGEDELDCVEGCDGIGCDGDRCVSHAQICDGISDCNDGSDEENCQDAGLPPDGGAAPDAGLPPDGGVSPDAAPAPDGALPPDAAAPVEVCDGMLCDGDVCRPRAEVCDGTPDCADATDETHCGLPSCAGFVCADDVCVPMEQLCDGQADCNDGSDEVACVLPDCDGLVCDGGGTCALRSQICDGTPDCADTEDERHCGGFCDGVLCADGRCARASDVCDGQPLCTDAEDEQNCPNPVRVRRFRVLDAAPPMGMPSMPPPPNPTPVGTVHAMAGYRVIGGDESGDVFVFVATGETGLWSRNMARPGAPWANATPAVNSDALSGEGFGVFALESYERLLWAGGDFGLALLYPVDAGAEWLSLNCGEGQNPETDDCFPSAPVPGVRAMAAYDGRLFIGTTVGLFTVGVDSERFTIDRVHHFPLDASINGLVVSGGRLYVMTDDRGLFFVQVGGTRR